jgi:hypothetical protein
MTFLFLLIVIAAVVALVMLRKGEALRFETQAAPSQVIMAATAAVGTGKRWAVAHQTDHSVTFTYTKKPSKLVALVLLCFFLVPGIVYLVLAGKKETLGFQIDRSTGNTIVQAVSNGYKGKFAARGVRTQLGVGAGTTAAVTHAQPAQPIALAQPYPPIAPAQPVQLPHQQIAEPAPRSPELA